MRRSDILVYVFVLKYCSHWIRELAKGGKWAIQGAHDFKISGYEPLCRAKVFSYVQMMETIALTCSRVGISFDFQFLAIVKRAAWSILGITVRQSTGMESMPRSSNANSGPLGLCLWAIEDITFKTLSQNSRKDVQDQKTWSRDFPDPHDLQQYGGAYLYAFDILREVKYHLVGNFWYSSLWLAQAEYLCAHWIAYSNGLG